VLSSCIRVLLFVSPELSGQGDHPTFTHFYQICKLTDLTVGNNCNLWIVIHDGNIENHQRFSRVHWKAITSIKLTVHELNSVLPTIPSTSVHRYNFALFLYFYSNTSFPHILEHRSFLLSWVHIACIQWLSWLDWYERAHRAW